MKIYHLSSPYQPHGENTLITVVANDESEAIRLATQHTGIDGLTVDNETNLDASGVIDVFKYGLSV